MDIALRMSLLVNLWGGTSMAKIRGKQDGPGGRNEHYDIGSQKNVPRRNVVAGIKRGEYSDVHIYKINGREYARDNPDRSKADNVNR
jgi:hypothetical protein